MLTAQVLGINWVIIQKVNKKQCIGKQPTKYEARVAGFIINFVENNTYI